MPVPYASDDLNRAFAGRTLTRGRSLVLIGAVELALDADRITGNVDDAGTDYIATITPSAIGNRVAFDNRCTCNHPGCVHLAATALAALDRYPALRKAEQRSFIDGLTKVAPSQERRRAAFEVAAGEPPAIAWVTSTLVGEISGKRELRSPAQLLADPASGPLTQAVARLLGGGEATRTPISSAALPTMLERLVMSGQGRWTASARKLIAGPERIFASSLPPKLPPGSAVLLSDAGPWYVDAATGMVGRVQLRRAAGKPAPVLRARAKAAPAPVRRPVADHAPVIVDGVPTPVLRMTRVQAPDEGGRPQTVDALTLAFEYEGARAVGEDTRQFVRVNGPAGPTFVRRDADAEAAAFTTLTPEGFVQMRVPDGKSARGQRVFIFHSRDASEAWHRFITQRVPALVAQGWRSLIDRDFGPRLVERVGVFDMRVADVKSGDGSVSGSFSLEFGIEIDGVRHQLLPILTHLMERGGIDAAQVSGDELTTSLSDGRIIKLPAERIRRLLAVMGDLMDSADRTPEGTLVLPDAEAAAVLDLEDLLETRWQNAAAIEAYVERFRTQPEILPVVVPASFKAVLRPYQHHGVDWLQHLRAHGLGGFLADDMGLGKTAQTIAHMVVEHAAGRLGEPALIVVPTSLVANWTAELTKFAPHLRVVVLHGLDRHERREQLDGIQVVITTYTVLARDVEEMKERSWAMVVLDEAQAIKSPDAKATRAVCQLNTGHRVCLSGTPIENNLEELWSQFAFLMPGLLGDRRGFAKRFRTPIEKRGDDMRRTQLVRRIAPFILRRTKSEVATELPPKHTILRRVTLPPEQRELYETIRVTLYEKVREQVADRSLAQSRIVVLDALLKLRQVCCDPRLVKLPSARLVETSSKLDELMEMVTEMIPEGRRILLFSQFTSMLDLIKPRMVEAGIKFVELRGDTRDRGAPVRAFEAGEVPLFLISLKAGGRGLNLTSADTVIHYDPWWNPAVEDQASDRAHRIGQTKSVFVYKLIAANTVEERILELQQRKAELAQIAFSDTSDFSGMDGDDIDYLFGANQERDAA